ncbi:Carboxylesterase [Thalictrum thalictroides]|uniref:Carboxylesterase n=1 Tax=Thalictrum thalictroides TaxID=46969 RepID=A0A7J6VLN7_THATH|nr:Carboxylesterase [Thalictrum thalictroides]
MADEDQSLDPINPYKLLSIFHNSDGTLTRPDPIPYSTTTLDNFAKDIPLNTANKTSLRLFRPIHPPFNEKLPIVIYFHGGGFILCSASTTGFHNFCASMSNKFPALIVSVDYRLAPENRLPLAYDDAMEAISWVQNQALNMNGEQWFNDLADFSKCYLMGCSSGGNIAYHAGLRAMALNIKPLVIRGLVLNQPFFGGCKRTDSELRLMNDKILPLAVTDMMWELALPNGCDRDHEYSNPMVDGNCNKMINLLGKCFVSVRGGDILMDHQMEFVRMLEGKGVYVVTWLEEGGYHGMELFEPLKAEPLFVALKDFVCSCKGNK